ncbi:DUF6161 domain-containing protein [Rothia sp. ZJ1223]|uniref:DUF6161 domain-containing protein n=1 Tax=Rothia sp. ZJ1223 TaxID=2811098 RepID=UPI001959550D|nr:DUF6161 domain-containing protein [Rothia sp. ZJ1223]MBM7051699.1 hypothetical protein [Rothia sp. ZJ1223]
MVSSEENGSAEDQLENLVRQSFNGLYHDLVEAEANIIEIHFGVNSSCTKDLRFPEMKSFMAWASKRCARTKEACDSQDALAAFLVTLKQPSYLYQSINSSYISQKLPDLWALKHQFSQDGDLSDFASDLLTSSKEQLAKSASQLAASDTDFRVSFSALTKKMTAYQSEINDWKVEQQQEIDNLEKLHREKLALEEPKKVWDHAATMHTIRAICWTLAAVAVAVVTIWKGSEAIHWLFTANLPKIPLLSNSFLAIALITFCVYTIRVFVKIALSNSHLAAAYRQKASMTYFYLSLMEKEKAVSGEERALILNSLFSSVDTGLVKPSDNKDLETLAAIAFKRA